MHVSSSSKGSHHGDCALWQMLCYALCLTPLSICCRSDKFDTTNMLGGAGPVASFAGPPLNPKHGLRGSSQGSGIPHLPVTIPKLDTVVASPLHSARSADSATSMKSAFSTLHPASLGSGNSNMHSRRTSAVGEPLAEFEDVFDAHDLEMGRDNDEEDASLLRSDAGRQSHQQSSSEEPGAHLSGNLSRPHGHSEARWVGVLQNPAVVRFGQTTKSWVAQSSKVNTLNTERPISDTFISFIVCSSSCSSSVQHFGTTP